MKGIEHLCRAAESVRAPGGDGRDRLRVAAHEFWAAVFHVESWPEPLRSRAERLTGRIFYYGNIDEAVRRMGDRTAAEVSHEIARLADEAEGLARPDAT